MGFPLVSRVGGGLLVGVNDKDSSNSSGQLQRSIRVRPPTLTERLTVLRSADHRNRRTKFCSVLRPGSPSPIEASIASTSNPSAARISRRVSM